ncbi:MAG TPA: type II toxin-antitoxin system YafQ family toxin [Spirochaetota bacterium]|nr:type II toxin-antitoxin system YafQ family toxin [Spirochaetota bacterium]HQP48351.1 type II toxin-antitoxin system YafQ family toxin [Spirochaetota bacterium]
MLIIQTTGQFDRDLKRIIKSGDKDILKIKAVMRQLAEQRQLESKYKDHKLIGNYKGRRECHIAPDWLLIYQYIGNDTVLFERTGSHSDLFKK